MRPEHAAVVVALLEDAVGERVVASLRKLAVEHTANEPVITGRVPEADRETGRRGGGDEPLLGVVGAGCAFIDQDHVDRLVQALAVDGLAQPMRDRAVTRDHPAPDHRQARRMRDRFRRKRNRRRAGLVLRVLLRVHGRSSDDNNRATTAMWRAISIARAGIGA